MQEYHIPIMVNEVISNLITNPNGIYIDLTFGGGGHSKEILKNISKEGMLISFDHDDDAEEQAGKILNDNFLFVKSNAIFLKNFLEYYGIDKVDGIFADIGVSSHQIDTASRGFSTRFDGPLDMRMNKKSPLTAERVVNTYSVYELEDMIKKYGELKSAMQIAKAIVVCRKKHRICTTKELTNILLNNVRCKKKNENKFLAQVFQSLRIEINNELDNLKLWLSQTKFLLKPGGRLAVLTYHSLEDRIVKRFCKFGSFTQQHETDFFGNYEKPFKVITKKALIPSNEEIKKNPRSSCAKLRVCEKI